MQSETTSFSGHDSLVDQSDKMEEARWQESFNPFDEQKLILDSCQQENVARFKGADNPYAAALADIFGLEV